MTRVNLVTETSWILGRCARELRDRLGWSINRPPDHRTFPIEYHLPYWRGLDRPRPPVRVGYFTHAFDRARRTAPQHDVHICMNRHMQRLLQSCTDTPDPPIIRPGVDATPSPLFGVAGRTYKDGRKGQALVTHATESGFRFVSLGPGWPCPQYRHRAGDRPTLDDAAHRTRFYQRIDYLVITATDEGGPMPVLEAIAHHTPVIAPDVGWCFELPVLRYDVGSWESLHAVLQQLTHTPTWDQWAEEHDRIFSALHP